MTKTLFLLRHAKTKVAHPGQPDLERTLKGRGWDDLKGVSSRLDAYGLAIDLILCSPAVRTRQTVEGLDADCLSKSDVQIENGLYNAEAAGVLALIQKTDDAVASLLVVGHNPGLHELTLHLAAPQSLKTCPGLHAHFPTSALAIFTFDVASWGLVGPEEGMLREFTTPH